MTMWHIKNSVTVNWSVKDSAIVHVKEDDCRTGNRFSCATWQVHGLDSWLVVSLTLTFVQITYFMPTKIISNYYYL